MKELTELSIIIFMEMIILLLHNTVDFKRIALRGENSIV